MNATPMPAMPTDRLAPMTRHEHEALFRAWITAHQGILVHVARGFARPEDRDDLVQDMLLAVWHAIPAFRGNASPSTYVYRVAQNTALAWQRADRRRPATEAIDDERHDAPLPHDAERTERLYAAIRTLGELDRALVLLYLDDMPYAEIAATLGLSETNVGARLTRARMRLAQLLKENDDV